MITDMYLFFSLLSSPFPHLPDILTYHPPIVLPVLYT